MNNPYNKPPRWASRLLKWFCADEQVEILLGDLEELYQVRRERSSKSLSNLHYIKDVFDLIRPFAIKRKSKQHKIN